MIKMTASAAAFNVNVSSRFNLLADEEECDPEETVQKIIQAQLKVVDKPKKDINGVLPKGNKIESSTKSAAPAKTNPAKSGNAVQPGKPIPPTTVQKDSKQVSNKPNKPLQNSAQEQSNPAVVRNLPPRFNKPTENATFNDRFEEDSSQLKENHFKPPRHFERRPAPDIRAQRQFDRHSGSDKTGVKPVEKKDGAGAHNWGTFEDDLKAEAAIQQNDPSEYSGLPPSTVGGEESTKTDGVIPDIPSSKLMTLQEYKAQQSKDIANMMSKLSTNNQQPDKVRVANDGADFGDMVAYKKVSERSDNDDEIIEGPTKQIVAIDIRFNDSDARGRGGGGGGFRGRGFGNKSMQIGGGLTNEVGITSPNAHLALDDEAAFPKLK